MRFTMNVGAVLFVAFGLVGCSAPSTEEAAQDQLQLQADAGPPKTSLNTISCRFRISETDASRPILIQETEVGPLERGELHWSVTLTDEAGASIVARIDHEIDGFTANGGRQLPARARLRMNNPFDGQEFFRDDATGELQWPASILINDESGSLRASAGKPGPSLVEGAFFASIIRNKTGHRWFRNGKEIRNINYVCIKARLNDN